MGKKHSFLITGCTKGIGFAIATHLNSLRYNVIGVARKSSLQEFPGSLYLADLSQAEETQAIFNKIKQQHHIDGIINNVGNVVPQLIDDLSIDIFNKVIDLNIRPAIQAMQIFLPGMKKQSWGRVVNITSRAMLGKAGRTSYSAAKAGLTAITRTWALELAKTGVTVNSVAPGPVATESFFENYPKGSADETKLLSTIPIGRAGHPDEIAYAVAFFLDKKAGFITGQSLFVDGGGSIGTSNY